MKQAFQFFISLLFSSTMLISAQSVEVYISDAGGFSNPPWKIIKFDENGENPETFTNKNLAWPQDILFLEDQQICLISNLNSGRITKYNSNNGAYLGNFAIGLSSPTRMKIGPDSLLYILQWGGSGKVKRYGLTGVYVDEFTKVGVPQSIGIDWDNNGNLYVSSYTQDYVRKFDKEGNDLGLFINSNLVGPTNIWFDDTGDLLVSDYDGTAVKRFDFRGNYKSDFLSGLSRSEGVGYLPNGNILIGNGATNSIKMYSSSGSFLKDFIPKNSGGLITPNAVYVRKIGVVSVSENENQSTLPNHFVLEQNYPNPFNPSTTINFSIPVVETGQVSILLRVFDVIGNEVATLVNETNAPGKYSIKFDGSFLSSGVYFYKLVSGKFAESKKMLILK